MMTARSSNGVGGDGLWVAIIADNLSREREYLELFRSALSSHALPKKNSGKLSEIPKTICSH